MDLMRKANELLVAANEIEEKEKAEKDALKKDLMTANAGGAAAAKKKKK